MNFCEICGQEGERHHIVWKSQGGIDFTLNYKYLCPKHHRGKTGPHSNRYVDILYKIQMQQKLQKILSKEYYTVNELAKILHLNKRQLKSVIRFLKLSKEGYKTQEIIFYLMGEKNYDVEVLEDYMVKISSKASEV